MLATAQGARAESSPGAPTHLTISYSEKVADELALWIAADAGYFKKRGLDVTERYLPAQEGIPALLTGQVQIAAIGGPDGISAAAQGAKLKYVATLSPVYTFQLWARPQYATASKLKGKQVGVSSTTGSLYAATVIALQQLGLTPSDVAITPLGSVQNVDNALLAGSIAAAASHPPATYVFKQHGFVDMVDLAEKRIPNVNTGLAVMTSYIQAHPKIVQSVVDAIVEALHREKTDKAYAEQEIRTHMGVKDAAVLEFTYNFYANEVAPSIPMPEISQFEAAKRALSVKNPKVKTVDLSALVDQRFVKTAVAAQNSK
ncbi:MAG TPA: ABC transporter substrate-binding protein [Stellaceae bacterium]|nr:ABC transporter substrate-binding protein [Stellaceae bacterium]